MGDIGLGCYESCADPWRCSTVRVGILETLDRPAAAESVKRGSGWIGLDTELYQHVTSFIELCAGGLVVRAAPIASVADQPSVLRPVREAHSKQLSGQHPRHLFLVHRVKVGRMGYSKPPTTYDAR